MYKKIKIIGVLLVMLVICMGVSAKEDSGDTVFVDIKGAVNNPGVYELDTGSRVIDAIILAGDLREDADTSIINLSKELKDGMFIIVYTKDEINTYKDKIIPSKTIVKEIENKIICPDTSNDACISDNDKQAGLININTASIEELTTLPGIGESKAKKIIEYREETPFETIEDIKNVSGIGDSAFDKIKNNITT
ncbi:MAG: DUF655 domain-containing protein [Bacilli bacterium]|nr:DUF655 domain-containing protein [Bacilli bacterium]